MFYRPSNRSNFNNRILDTFFAGVTHTTGGYSCGMQKMAIMKRIDKSGDGEFKPQKWLAKHTGK